MGWDLINEGRCEYTGCTAAGIYSWMAQARCTHCMAALHTSLGGPAACMEVVLRPCRVASSAGASLSAAARTKCSCPPWVLSCLTCATAAGGPQGEGQRAQPAGHHWHRRLLPAVKLRVRHVRALIACCVTLVCALAGSPQTRQPPAPHSATAAPSAAKRCPPWLPAWQSPSHLGTLSGGAARSINPVKNSDGWPLRTGQDFLPNHDVSGVRVAGCS